MSSAMALGWKIELNRCESHKAFSFGGENLEGCVRALEEERGKIEAFKRELPLCMQIVTDALEALKLHLAEQKQQSSDPSTSCSLLQLSCSSFRDEMRGQDTKSDSAVLEEFIPPKTLEEESSQREKVSNDADLDKPSWMAQVQLWSEAKHQKASPTRPQAKHAVPGIFANPGGAFSPFVRTNPRTTEEQPSSNETGLQLSSSESSRLSALGEETRATIGSSAEKRSVEATSSAAAATRTQYETNSQRKARRCWSPELHRRFLNALQQLGGSHVATPKQIRDIMKVDGLTNDEVKSHLQKYRLHTRRPPVQSSGSHDPATPVVVLSGIWASEFAAASLRKNPTAAAIYQTALAQQPQQEAALESDTQPASVPQEQEGDECQSGQQKKHELHSSEQQDEEMDDGDVTENEDTRSDRSGKSLITL